VVGPVRAVSHNDLVTAPLHCHSSAHHLKPQLPQSLMKLWQCPQTIFSPRARTKTKSVAQIIIDVTWPSYLLYSLLNLCGAPVVVKSFARKSTWPTKSCSSAIRIYRESLCFRADPPLSSLCGQLKSGMHSYESYHHNANPPPPKAKPYK